MTYNECPQCWGTGTLTESETRKYYVQTCSFCGTVIKTPKKKGIESE